MLILRVVVAVLVVLSLLPAVSAGTSERSEGHCESFPITAVLGLIGQNDIKFCVYGPMAVATSTSTFGIDATLTTPPLLGAAPTVTVSVLPGSPMGCSLANFVAIGTAANAGFGAQVNARADITMASSECSVGLKAKVTSNAVTIFDAVLYIDTHSLEVYGAINNFQCGATGTTANAQNPMASTCQTNLVTSLDYLCASSGLAPPTSGNIATLCQTPTYTVRDYVCAATGVAPATSGPMTTLCANPSIRNYLCQATTTTTNPIPQSECLTPTINTVLSGTISALVSGGLTVTLAPGGSLAVTGIPDTQQEIQAIADALAAGLTVHLCGQAGACGVIETNANTTFYNNGNMTSIFPDTLHLCGLPGENGTCLPIQAQGGVTFPDGDGMHGLGFWIQLLFFLGWLLLAYFQELPMLAGFSIPGVLLTLFPLLGGWSFELGVVGLVFGVAIEFFDEKKRGEDEENGEVT